MKKEIIPIFKSLVQGQEEFVRHLFSIYASKIGFEIIQIQKRFPDCIAIDKRNGRNEIVYVELEDDSMNFIYHGHNTQVQSVSHKCICVCWNNSNSIAVRNCVPGRQIEVVSLQELPNITFELIEPPTSENKLLQEKKIIVMYYNTRLNSNIDISFYQNINLYTTNSLNNLKNNSIPKGSKIIFIENNEFIAELTVEKYVYIEERPNNEKERLLYELATYPNGELAEPNLENDWNKSHVIYSNFRVFNPKVFREFIPNLREKQLPKGGGFTYITEEQYNDIVRK